jgi:pimeloyl-ACP methyl ester carboxylesterase
MRNSVVVIIALLSLFFVGCQEEPEFIGKKIDETIFLREKGSDMPIRIMGNTSSKVLILFVHGGPGEGAWFQHTTTPKLLEKYVIAFWDQRSSGSAQSNTSTPLHVNLFVDDMKKVVLLLNEKFGSDFKIYIWSHSWGGVMSTLYFGQNNYPDNVKGWINMDGACNPVLVGDMEKEAIGHFGNEEIAAGRNMEEWKTMMDFCTSHDTITTLDDFFTINGYAGQAQATLPNVYSFNAVDFSMLINGQNSVMAYMINNKEIFTNQLPFLYEIFFETDLSDRLSSIEIPTLNLWGKYDMVVPLKMAELVSNSIKSSIKETVIFEHSAHAPIASEPDAVNDAIIDFIERMN